MSDIPECCTILPKEWEQFTRPNREGGKMTTEAERTANIAWLNAEIAEADILGNSGRAEVYRGIVADLTQMESVLDYVASCFHVAYHGIKDAPTWQECERQPCRAANGRLPSVRRVGLTPATDAATAEDNP